MPEVVEHLLVEVVPARSVELLGHELLQRFYHRLPESRQKYRAIVPSRRFCKEIRVHRSSNAYRSQRLVHHLVVVLESDRVGECDAAAGRRRSRAIGFDIEQVIGHREHRRERQLPNFVLHTEAIIVIRLIVITLLGNTRTVVITII